jgi:CRISPR system Cascade subunit CasA
MMQFNLIDEKWIPVKRRDGSEDRIRPWEVTERFKENPVVNLNAPRPDFNGALVQFLIGLVQTTFAPKDIVEWKRKLKTPPSTDQLKAAFMTVHHAFELGGCGPRFMQDYQRSGGEEWGIASLLLDSPGENRLKNNQDHFVKRDTITAMCASCCAAALYTLQINAPYGGVGHQSSIRGGGPLTTLILSQQSEGASIWKIIWLNILDKQYFLNCCANADKEKDKDIFPWLAPTRTSQKKGGKDTTPQDVHPSQLFWSMSRRIVLDVNGKGSARCDLCGNLTSHPISKYRALLFGTSYMGSWLHPLSPHRRTDQRVFALQTQPGGVTYRHWLGLVQEDKKRFLEPALVVHNFRERRQGANTTFRIWAFGYDLDPQRPTITRCWYESIMPLTYVNPKVREDYERDVRNVIAAASEVAGNVRAAIKRAWFRRPADVKGDTSFVASNFWQNTESDFYTALSDLKADRESNYNVITTKQKWHKALYEEAMRLFDEYAWNGPIEDADPKRVVIAREELRIYNHSKKVKELLGLPIEKPTTQKRKTKKIPA